MSSAVQNQLIARLIVGAMSIDGELTKKEAEKVARTLSEIGMPELVADVGAVIEAHDIDEFNMFKECRKLTESLGTDADMLAPMIFRLVCDVVANDRFVSEREATYLSAMAKRLGLTVDSAKSIFKQVMAMRRSRLESSGTVISEDINPYLKELLSFQGAEDLVGEADEDSIGEMMHAAKEAMDEGEQISHDEMARSLTILGLGQNAKLEDAEEVWKDTINNLDLPKMAELGETFVSAAINRITRINDAYKTILHFHDQHK